MIHSEFDCCKHFALSKKHLRIVEDQNGNKLQWWVSESIAKTIDNFMENHPGEYVKIEVKNENH